MQHVNLTTCFSLKMSTLDRASFSTF